MKDNVMPSVADAPNPTPGLRLHIIGAGCPQPRAERFGSAFVLELGDERVLVDCGPGTTYKMARMGMDPLKVGHLFLTHHHSDHNADVPCFLLCWWDQCKGSETPCTIYGPQPTCEFVERLIGKRGAFRPDIDSRLEHPASMACHEMRHGVMPRPAPAFAVRELADGAEIETPRWRLQAAAIRHVEPTLTSLAYRFDTDMGSVVFAGDGTDCRRLRELSAGADTLVICCTHFGPSSIHNAIADCAPGVPDVAAIARDTRVKRLVLTHMSPNFEKPDARRSAVDEVAANCDSDVVCPDELSTVSL